MKKRYIIHLSKEERQLLKALVRKGKAAASRRTHAQVLLWADEGKHGPGLIDREVGHTVGVSEKPWCGYASGVSREVWRRRWSASGTYATNRQCSTGLEKPGCWR